MAAPTLKYAIGNSSSTTLSAGISNTDTSAPLTSDTNFNAKSGAGMILMAEGESSEELAYATALAGGSLTIPVANRGLESTTAATQASASTVKGILTAGMWNDLIDAVTNVCLATTGALDTSKVVDLTTAQTLTNKTITCIKSVQTWNTATDAATVTFNLSLGNLQTVTLGGNRTLALSNASTGQCFVIRLLQDGTGSRTVTWFSTIKWAGGSAPTLTTTASKADVLGFICTGTNTYDGFIVGQNL